MLVFVVDIISGHETVDTKIFLSKANAEQYAKSVNDAAENVTWPYANMYEKKVEDCG
jgi:hypothetical protein